MPEVLKESEKLNPHKRPKEPEKVRKLILQTAEKLASAGGEDSVSFAKIAKRSGAFWQFCIYSINIASPKLKNLYFCSTASLYAFII